MGVLSAPSGQIHDEGFRKHFRRTLITFATTLGYYNGLFDAAHVRGRLGGAFWFATISSHFDIAVIEWCKVLGTNSEMLHWKRAFDEADHDALRAKVLAATGKTSDEWHTYHDEIVEYRNSAGAHYDPAMPAPKYPALGVGQAAAGVIYDKLQALYNVGGPNIDAICSRAANKASEVADTYLKGRDAG